MKKRRIVVPGLDLDREKLCLSPETTHYVTRVLRLGPGDELQLNDGTGRTAQARIVSTSADRVDVHILQTTLDVGTYSGQIHLIQALPKGGKIDEIIRRVTELGVTSIRPCLAHRSVARPESHKAKARLQRWQRITAEASRQCHRSELPLITPLVELAEALHLAPVQTSRFLLWEGEHSTSLSSCLKNLDRKRGATLVIGPEGGFTVDEASLARNLGYTTASLGRRILRTETAAVTCCAIVQYALGGFDT